MGEQKVSRLLYSATSIICDSSAIKADYFLLCSYLEHLNNTEELNWLEWFILQKL